MVPLLEKHCMCLYSFAAVVHHCYADILCVCAHVRVCACWYLRGVSMCHYFRNVSMCIYVSGVCVCLRCIRVSRSQVCDCVCLYASGVHVCVNAEWRLIMWEHILGQTLCWCWRPALLRFWLCLGVCVYVLWLRDQWSVTEQLDLIGWLW